MNFCQIKRETDRFESDIASLQTSNTSLFGVTAHIGLAYPDRHCANLKHNFNLNEKMHLLPDSVWSTTGSRCIQ